MFSFKFNITQNVDIVTIYREYVFAQDIFLDKTYK